MGPTQYPSDSIWSYELGAKQMALNDHMHFDGAVFHATWSNGAQALGNCLYTHMPGPAESNGIEFYVKALWQDTTASLGVAYTDAHYTKTIMDGGEVVVSDGDALGTPPLVISPWNLTASIEHRFTLDSGAGVTLRAENIYHSRNPGPFYTSDPGSSNPAPGLEPDPATNMLNLR